MVKGTCNQADCIAACSLNLFVKDGIVWREEQNPIFRASGEHLPDFNPRGCQKGMVYADLMYDATRIKYPMRRVGPRGSGKWERISWEDALTTIADGSIHRRAWLTTSRVPCEGTAETTRRAPPRARDRSAVGCTLGLSSRPGR